MQLNANMLNTKSLLFMLFLLFTSVNSSSIDSVQKEIGGSLLELIDSPSKEITNQRTRKTHAPGELSKLISSSGMYDSKKNLFLSTKLKNKQIYHAAFPNPETTKMRKWGLVTLVIFGTLYLLIRTGYNYMKTLDKFFAKGVIALSNQILLLFICLAILIVTYTYGAFDNIYVNWEYLIGAIAIVMLSWIFFNFFLLTMCLFINRKWEVLEYTADSFKQLKKSIKANSSKAKDAKESFEFLVLKKFFFTPLFPVLKSVSLRNELKFSYYFELCLLSKLRLFFKLSWTTWFALIVIMMFWNVFIIPSSLFAVFIFIMLIPLIGIAMTFGIYIYSLKIYRKIVSPVNDDNINDYKDIEYNSNDIFQSMSYPPYLLKYIDDDNELKKSKQNSFSFHEHMHQRPPSLYEKEIFFGQSGPYFLLNLLQCCCFIFICWTVTLFGYYGPKLSKEYNNTVYLYMIAGFVFYLVLQLLMTTIAMKWLTVISSVEMKRNDKCVNKMINHKMKEMCAISNSVLNSFKKIYYDVNLRSGTPTPIGDNNEYDDSNQLIDSDNNSVSSQNQKFKLTSPNIKEFLKLNYNRFKKANNTSIDIQYELRPFLKSCGNIVNNEELEFILYLIGKSKKYNGTLNLNQLFDICGAILHFRQKNPQMILKFVFDNYYMENKKVYRDVQMKWSDVEVFLGNYQEYFNKKQRHFIESESKYLGDSFTLDSFIAMILTPSQYNPY